MTKKLKRYECHADTPQCQGSFLDTAHGSIVMCDGCAEYLGRIQFEMQGPSPHAEKPQHLKRIK